MPISKNIKKLREMHGLSQKDLAEIAGVTDKAVSTWEKGIKEPRMGAIQKMADHFKIRKSNIIEDNGLEILRKDFVHIHDGTISKYAELSEENKKIIDKQIQYLLYEQNQESEE